MFRYVENPDTIESQEIKIFVPYTEIQPATLISIFDYDYKLIKVEGEFGYFQYFIDRWEEDETFINVEHDTVPYPGAIKALWDCPEIWCAYDHSIANWSTQEAELNSIPLGCTKITAEMMKLLKDCWKKPIDWQHCDIHLFQTAKANGLSPHQHFPGVINANPALLERRKI